MTKLQSWGRLNNLEHDVINLYNLHELSNILKLSTVNKKGLAYGNGRSYGDVCLNPDGIIWDTKKLNKFINFDPELGTIVCEAGVLLKDIQQLVIQQGWMLAVTPGTQLITVGGAIANDVHGKNHHIMGTFGHHINWFNLYRTDGQVFKCSPIVNQDYFKATIGGLGLTGVIGEVEIQLRKIDNPFLEVENVTYESLEEFLSLSLAAEKNWEYIVSWFDCITPNVERGIFSRARHCSNNEQIIDSSIKLNPTKNKKLILPFNLPCSLVNKYTLKLFNNIYYNFNKFIKPNKFIQYYEDFLYPLDSVLEWNRIYGKNGFYQYQCVIPNKNEIAQIEPVRAMLTAIANSKQGSFLTVIKKFGNMPPAGLLSFPIAGITIAIDFPNLQSKTLNLFKEFDSIVKSSGGRIYCAKDVRMSKDLFSESYSNLEKFLLYQDHGISSLLSKRLIENKKHI